MVLTEYNEELHLKNVRECGYEEGRIREQMELVIKKVRKGQSLEQIADALEKTEDQLKEKSPKRFLSWPNLMKKRQRKSGKN